MVNAEKGIVFNILHVNPRIRHRTSNLKYVCDEQHTSYVAEVTRL